jgi:hypothetical protein
MHTRRARARAAAAAAPPPPALPEEVHLAVLNALLTSLALPDEDAYVLFPHRSSFAWLAACARPVCHAWAAAAAAHPAFVRRGRLERLLALAAANDTFQMLAKRGGAAGGAAARERAACKRRLSAPLLLLFAAATAAAPAAPRLAAAAGGGAAAGPRAVAASVVGRLSGGEARGLPATALMVSIEAAALSAASLGELMADLALLDGGWGAPVIARVRGALAATGGGSGSCGGSSRGGGSGSGGSGGGSDGGGGGGGSGGGDGSCNTQALAGDCGPLTVEAARAVWAAAPGLRDAVNLEAVAPRPAPENEGGGSAAPALATLYIIPMRGFRRRVPKAAAAAAAAGAGAAAPGG